MEWQQRLEDEGRPSVGKLDNQSLQHSFAAKNKTITREVGVWKIEDATGKNSILSEAGWKK